MSKYFNDYLKRLEGEYQNARKAYKEAVEELQEIEEAHKVDISPNMQKRLSAEGRSILANDYMHKRGEAMRKLDSVQMDFERTAKAIRGEVQQVFNPLFDADENKVDLRAVEIIKSGILSDAETLRMAERYKAEGNNTMYRMVCKSAEGRPDTDMKNLASHANSPVPRKDLELYDNLLSAYSMALRPREVSASNAIDSRLHDMAYEQTLQMGEGIKIEGDAE